MRQHEDYLKDAFFVMDLALHQYVLPLGKSAAQHSLSDHEQWQRERHAEHQRCAVDTSARRRWFRAAAGEYDLRCGRERAAKAYREEMCDGKRPARRSVHEADMARELAALIAVPRTEGPSDALDAMLRLMHQSVVAVSNKHRAALQRQGQHAPVADAMAPHNNRQEGDLSIMKVRLNASGATRAGVLDAVLRVKHGSYSLQQSPLTDVQRAELPHRARETIAAWATHRQKAATTLAAYEGKEGAAEAKRAARAMRQLSSVPGAESKKEKKEESDDEDEDQEVIDAMAEAAGMSIDDGSGVSGNDDDDDDDDSEDDDEDGERATRETMAATQPRTSSFGRNVRRKSFHEGEVAPLAHPRHGILTP
jgi:hypothetical protein